MFTQKVEFQFITGLKRQIFRNARLSGSWDANGTYSTTWTEWPMQQGVGIDGCPCFTAIVPLNSGNPGQLFTWGVILDGPQGANFWGIPTETHNDSSVERYRQFTLAGGETIQIERYYFTYLRRLGANKFFPVGQPLPVLHFAVWAPNAQQVDVVFGDSTSGYITDTGDGIDPVKPVVPLARLADGIWEGETAGSFDDFKSLPYMYHFKCRRSNRL
jgi:1,4-alpha-glucan branching enzyme